jgi:nicotinamidase-related amidase
MRSPLILEPKDTVLLIIDIQEKLFRTIEGRPEIEKNAIKAVKLAKVFGLPMLVTEQYPKGLGPTIPTIAQELGSFAPIPKTEYSAFGQPPFVSALAATGRKTVMLLGIEAHICVTQTALDAIANGYKVHVIADAVGSSKERSKDIGIGRMQQAGAVISSIESAAFDLMGKAKTKEFEEISKFLF